MNYLKMISMPFNIIILENKMKLGTGTNLSKTAVQIKFVISSRFTQIVYLNVSS